MVSLDRLLDAEIEKIHAGYQKQADEINAKIQAQNVKIRETNQRIDTYKEAVHLVISNVREEYKDDPAGCAALDRLREYYDLCANGTEGEAPKPKPTEVEVIPPQRHLAPAPIERMMHEVIEAKPEPQPELCRHGYEAGKCIVIQVGYDCPHYYNRNEARYPTPKLE